ncbi:MAG: hypothetical protein ACLRWQ_16740 [Flavonifractor plautii]
MIYRDLGKTVVEGARRGDYVYDWVAYVDGAELGGCRPARNEKDPDLRVHRQGCHHRDLC